MGGHRGLYQEVAPGIPLYLTRAKNTFLEMVEHRQMWPSPQQRQCTSDLERPPLQTLIRRLAKERGITLIVSCEGLRAQESYNRKNAPAFTLNNRLSKAGRRV